ncbi:hypothetical protein BDQ94DRAFT_133885 [Aspergillus welwitschiae]|uniref:Uncharacterized protein n=1 Tax=Aspergillus welwitschiae TaxID=1341132 RepID=A0A3F3QHT9_9EURO|nr:hypothetical protein BDQ94DRAFT_133885 [Aspergillus welwitschiae]RDH38442.1 hypothetical protein BDQ94DRAFT_133885 [Aspergillus welwitschiae]
MSRVKAKPLVHTASTAGESQNTRHHHQPHQPITTHTSFLKHRTSLKHNHKQTLSPPQPHHHHPPHHPHPPPYPPPPLQIYPQTTSST